MSVGAYVIPTHTVLDSIHMVFVLIVEHPTVPFLSSHMKKLIDVRIEREHSFRRNIQTRDPDAQGPIWVAALVRAITVSVFVKIKEEIILYILYRTFFSRHLSCATGQAVRSQNIEYYGISIFCPPKICIYFKLRRLKKSKSLLHIELIFRQTPIIHGPSRS